MPSRGSKSKENPIKSTLRERLEGMPRDGILGLVHDYAIAEARENDKKYEAFKRTLDGDTAFQKFCDDHFQYFDRSGGMGEKEFFSLVYYIAEGSKDGAYACAKAWKRLVDEEIRSDNEDTAGRAMGFLRMLISYGIRGQSVYGLYDRMADRLPQVMYENLEAIGRMLKGEEDARRKIVIDLLDDEDTDPQTRFDAVFAVVSRPQPLERIREALLPLKPGDLMFGVGMAIIAKLWYVGKRSADGDMRRAGMGGDELCRQYFDVLGRNAGALLDLINVRAKQAAATPLG